MNDPQLQQFLRKVSHDLSAPARSAVGFSTILLDTNESLDEQARKWLELIKNEGLYSQTVLARLSQYAKLFDDHHLLNSCDLNTIVADAIAHSPVVTNAVTNQKLTVSYSDLPTVSGTSAHWEMLVTELLENSVVHNSEAEHINMTISADEQQLYFSDDGHGIDAKFFEKASKPLVSMTNARTAGFGLAICDKIAKITQAYMSLHASDKGGLMVIFDLSH